MNKLQTFCIDQQIQQSTINLYTSCVKLYEQICGLTLDELIKEADTEEEQGIRWKNRKLKERLIHFRNYLFANKSEGTAKRYLSCIKTIYTHFEIEWQPLPSFNSKNIDKTFKMDYEDLLNINEIKDAYYEANNVTKCIILFAISSGLSKVDMLNMSVSDFIRACEPYLGTDVELISKLKSLKDKDIIPCFRGARQKTKSKYTTFCSPEASEHIIQYLLGRDAQIREKYNESDEEERKKLPSKLDESMALFDVSDSHLQYTFRKINNKLNLGTVGKFTKLRCHMLRKYHASTLLNSEIITWTVEEIDTLQGRSMDITHQAYFKNSKDKLFNKYRSCVDELMLFKEVNGVDKETVEKLEKENNFYKKEIVKNENKLEEQQKTIREIIENQRELEKMLGLQ
ncbi:MAG: hypothetical protein UHM08_08690 [Bacteroidales bacterium]|nr:hypothetical protein [Bacteroidales bacterium]